MLMVQQISSEIKDARTCAINRKQTNKQQEYQELMHLLNSKCVDQCTGQAILLLSAQEGKNLLALKESYLKKHCTSQVK